MHHELIAKCIFEKRLGVSLMKHASKTREKHAPGARLALPHEKFHQVVEAIVQIILPKLGHVTVQFNHLISAKSSCKSFSTRPCNRSPTQNRAKSVSQHGQAKRGCGHVHPCCRLRQCKAVHSHEESDNTSVVQTLALRRTLP